MVLPDWSVKVTVAPGVPVPVMSGRWLLVELPGAGPLMATGAPVTVKLTLLVVVVSMPLMAWVAVTVTGPSGRGAAGVTVQVPSPATAA